MNVRVVEMVWRLRARLGAIRSYRRLLREVQISKRMAWVIVRRSFWVALLVLAARTFNDRTADS